MTSNDSLIANSEAVAEDETKTTEMSHSASPRACTSAAARSEIMRKLQVVLGHQEKVMKDLQHKLKLLSMAPTVLKLHSTTTTSSIVSSILRAPSPTTTVAGDATSSPSRARHGGAGGADTTTSAVMAALSGPSSTSLASSSNSLELPLVAANNNEVYCVQSSSNSSIGSSVRSNAADVHASTDSSKRHHHHTTATTTPAAVVVKLPTVNTHYDDSHHDMTRNTPSASAASIPIPKHYHLIHEQQSASAAHPSSAERDRCRSTNMEATAAITTAEVAVVVVRPAAHKVRTALHNRQERAAAAAAAAASGAALQPDIPRLISVESNSLLPMPGGRNKQVGSPTAFRSGGQLSARGLKPNNKFRVAAAANAVIRRNSRAHLPDNDGSNKSPSALRVGAVPPPLRRRRPSEEITNDAAAATSAPRMPRASPPQVSLPPPQHAAAAGSQRQQRKRKPGAVVFKKGGSSESPASTTDTPAAAGGAGGAATTAHSGWDFRERMRELEAIQATNSRARLERTHSATYTRTTSLRSQRNGGSPPRGSLELPVDPSAQPAPQFASLEDMERGAEVHHPLHGDSDDAALATAARGKALGGGGGGGGVALQRRGSTASGSGKKLTAMRLAATSPRVRGFGQRLGMVVLSQWASQTIPPAVAASSQQGGGGGSEEGDLGLGYHNHDDPSSTVVAKSAATATHNPPHHHHLQQAITKPNGLVGGASRHAANKPSVVRPPWSSTMKVATHQDPVPLARSEAKGSGGATATTAATGVATAPGGAATHGATDAPRVGPRNNRQQGGSAARPRRDAAATAAPHAA